MPVRIFTPTQQTIVLMALDTGASTSAISDNVATLLGYDINTFETDIELIALSGTGLINRFVADRIEIQEHQLLNFPMLCYTARDIPEIDGVLGLDFPCGKRLEIDFRSGLVTLD